MGNNYNEKPATSSADTSSSSLAENDSVYDMKAIKLIFI